MKLHSQKFLAKPVRAAVAVAVGACFLTSAVAPSYAQRTDRPSERLPRHLDDRTVKAIKRGLEYLAGTQRNDGSWMSPGGQGSYPAVMTSLAGLALLASGSTPTEGPYSKHLRKAMDYMMSVADPNSGLISGPGGEGRSIYGHGFGMLFLAECYGNERDVETRMKLKRILDKAIQLSAGSQSPQGGWYYTPESRSDEGSTTVTQMQGLRACRNAGLKVPPSTVERSGQYLKACQNADGGIQYSFSSKGASRPPITAAAVATLYAAGQYENPMAHKALQYVVKTIMPTKGHQSGGGHWYYTHFYMAQAMYQVHDERYDKYFPVLRDTLLAEQAVDGSWTGDGVGTIYGTSIACIVLQLPYDYMPIFQR